MEKNKKKEIRENYKIRELIGGVFMIKNKVTGKLYIQGVTNLSATKKKFEFMSNTMNQAIIYKLNDDYKKYGYDAFEYIELESLIKKEEQTNLQFKAEIKLLEEIYKEKYQDIEQY